MIDESEDINLCPGYTLGCCLSYLVHVSQIHVLLNWFRSILVKTRAISSHHAFESL